MGLFSFLSKNKQGSDTDDDTDAPVTSRRSSRSQAAPDPVDPVLPQKKRARRRLIGASALVLAAVIGLPMIFDSEPKPLADDIEIQIPSRDKVSAGGAASAPAAREAQASRAPLPGEPATTNLPDNNTSAPATQTPAPRVAGVPSAVSAAPSREQPSRFIVQVAAVATQAKADELQNKLKKAGIQSYAKKITLASGDRFRVRIGPFNSRAEADKMLAKLSKLGLPGVVQAV